MVGMSCVANPPHYRGVCNITTFLHRQCQVEASVAVQTDNIPHKSGWYTYKHQQYTWSLTSWHIFLFLLDFQSRKQLYIHKCLFVCQSQKPLNSLKSSSFIILHHSSSFFIILHHSSSFFIHPSFILQLLSFSAFLFLQMIFK